MQQDCKPTKYLTPLTPAQMKDVQELIAYTEANRKPLRKPRIRRRDPNSTPRPVNCFLVYRKEKQAQIADLCVGANHRVISKIVARWWKSIDEETKAVYVEVAKQIKKDHAKKYPGYKYAPKRKQTSTNENSMRNNTTQPVAPANVFFKKLEENNFPESSTAFVQHQLENGGTPSFDCAIYQQFYDILYARYSYFNQNYAVSNAPPLSHPVVDDSLAQYMYTNQWQMDTTLNQVMVPPRLTVTNTSSAYFPCLDTDWSATINPQKTMVQQQDAIHPLDPVDPSNPLYFSAMDDTLWPMDSISFASANNNNMLDLTCTPELLAANDSPLSLPSASYRPDFLSHNGSYNFVDSAFIVQPKNSSSL